MTEHKKPNHPGAADAYVQCPADEPVCSAVAQRLAIGVSLLLASSISLGAATDTEASETARQGDGPSATAVKHAARVLQDKGIVDTLQDAEGQGEVGQWSNWSNWQNY